MASMFRDISRAMLLAGAAPAMGQSGVVAQTALAAVEESGDFAGAPYRIDVPSNWNRGLVVFFHGYEPDDPREARHKPWQPQGGTSEFLKRGYAVIQSGYSKRGWAVAEARTDTRRLRAEFERRFGQPGRTYAAGYSMGGHLALATVEQEASRYDGALALCPAALSATELFDRIVTNLAAASALFPEEFPDVASPDSTATVDSKAFGRALAANSTAANRLGMLVGIRPTDLPEVLPFFYVVVRELAQRSGGFPATNAHFRYRGFGDDRAFNRRVRRYFSPPAARSYVKDNATLTGRISDPVVLLGNIYDNVVPNETAGIYPARVRAAGRAARLTILPPVGDGHCNFKSEDIGRAFDSLTEQVEGLRRGP